MAIGLDNTAPNQTTKKKESKIEFKEFTEQTVKEDLQDQIMKSANNKRYMSLAKLASSYMLTVKDFRKKCFESEELANLLQVYNGNYVEDTMAIAMQKGSINSQVETYLKEELQAFTGVGLEQNINWHQDYSPLVHRETGEDIPFVIDKYDATEVKGESIFKKMKMQENADNE